MNFLKTFYLAAGLLGCVTLAAMHDVPSDNEVTASIARIIKRVETEGPVTLAVRREHLVNPATPFINWVHEIIEKAKSFHDDKNECLICLEINPQEEIYLGGTKTNACTSKILISVGALKKCTLPELRFTLAHEMGHILLNHEDPYHYVVGLFNNHPRLIHSTKYATLLGVSTGITFGLYGNLIAGLISATTIPTSFICTCIWLMNSHSRKNEFAADAFAAQALGHVQALESFLLKSRDESLTNKTQQILYEIRNLLGMLGHPHYKDRISRIKKIIPDNKKQN